MASSIKGGSGGGGPDIGSLIGQAIGIGRRRILQNYNDLGLGPAGSNWTDPTGRWNSAADAPPVFPAGTPFAGTFSGFPPGTPAGTLPTATLTDLANLNTQAGGAFAPLADAQNQINQQAQQAQSGASGLLGGLGNLGGTGGNLGNVNSQGGL